VTKTERPQTPEARRIQGQRAGVRAEQLLDRTTGGRSVTACSPVPDPGAGGASKSYGQAHPTELQRQFAVAYQWS